MSDFNKALELDPKDAVFYAGRATVWARCGNWDKAIADCNEAIRLQPKIAMAFAVRGQASAFKNDPDQALRDFNTALELNPKDIMTVGNRGCVFLAKQQWEKALADFNAVVAAIPNERVILYNRALLRVTCPDAKFRDVKTAFADAKQLCEMTAWSASELDLLAMVYAEAGQFDDAVKLEKRALEDATFAAAAGDQARERLKLYEQKKPYRLPEK